MQVSKSSKRFEQIFPRPQAASVSNPQFTRWTIPIFYYTKQTPYFLINLQSHALFKRQAIDLDVLYENLKAIIPSLDVPRRICGQQLIVSFRGFCRIVLNVRSQITQNSDGTGGERKKRSTSGNVSRIRGVSQKYDVFLFSTGQSEAPFYGPEWPVL